jgi:hypothetical protein
MGESANLAYEIQHLRNQLIGLQQAARWRELGGALARAAELGELGGQRELCLRAQGLRELMGERLGGSVTPGPRADELFTDLMFHLSHFQWICQADALSAPLEPPPLVASVLGPDARAKSDVFHGAVQ